MTKTQKKQAQEYVSQLEQIHNQIKECVVQNNISLAMELLVNCQSKAILLGTFIEQTEGENTCVVSKLEEYCEIIYNFYENLEKNKEINANKIYKILRQKLIKIANSIKNDIKVKIEAVFLPYKASMWDSLETVWKAADNDPDCDAYVIPISYYDKNLDGSFREMHYEAEQYPEDVPIIKYDAFDFAKHMPDMIFIHYPYDGANIVTSVHPFFYSDNLKKFTNCLVYIPYYATSGGMSEGQGLCPAYLNADYIVIQSEKYRKFYDSRIPDGKFLALGSPKFDKVIDKCLNPPTIPREWSKKFKGKKIYFYNTSIGGMLENTDAFIKKIQYVFGIFKGRTDVCLLWRPHPLMESTLDSMRKEYKSQYLMLKKKFVEEDIGILDESADIENTIALCDAYIGDSATSVTSLFGVAGKPIFILNNYINTLPDKDDWRGEIMNSIWLDMRGNDHYWVTSNNQLWFSERNDYHYKFFMDLQTGYSGGRYYMKAVKIKNKIYVLPQNARNLLIIEDKKLRSIDLKVDNFSAGAFWSYFYNEEYIFLLPLRCSYLVRFHIRTEEIVYIDGVRQFNVRNVNGQWSIGGVAPYGNELVFASPVDNHFLFVEMDTLKIRILSNNSKSNIGTLFIVFDDDELWLLPTRGLTITRWNPKTGEMAEYSDVPRDFKSIKWPYGIECDEKPFYNLAISRKNGKETIIIAPYWGNMYLSLDRMTGKMERWEPPFFSVNRSKDAYFQSASMGCFLNTYLPQGESEHYIWYEPERKLYCVNIDTKEYKEIEIKFNEKELMSHELGFAKESEWMQYCLKENAFQSIVGFIDNKIIGNSFDREKQLEAFSKINANRDGTCGESIYNLVKGKIS